jgi:hypothetical protein
VHSWIWFVFLAVVLIKMPIAAYMLWVPFRSDAALESHEPAEPDSPDEDDGGSRTRPEDFRRHRRPRGPSGPRRGPHGGGASPSPSRIRAPWRHSTRTRRTRVTARQ